MNKTVIITGGAQGIGKCTTKHLLSCGYNVAIADIVSLTPHSPAPPPDMSENLQSIRSTLRDLRAVEMFDNMFQQMGRDSNRMELAVRGMRGNVEERMLDRWMRLAPSPAGVALDQVPGLLTSGEMLRNEIQAFRDANPQIRGINEWLRRLNGEIRNLNEMQRGRFEATLERVQGASNNINGVEGEFQIARVQTGVIAVNQEFTFFDEVGNQRAIDVDIVADNGNSWIDVKRVPTFGLETTDWLGHPSERPPGVSNQALRMRQAAEQNPNDGIVPTVIFEFILGVSREVADALQSMEIEVRGAIVDFAE